MSVARVFRADVLRLEVKVRRQWCLISQSTEGPWGWEHLPEKAAIRHHVREFRNQGCIIKKKVKPAQRKEVVRHWVMQGWMSERQACQMAVISRSCLKYRRRRPKQHVQLNGALLTKATLYPQYGYLMLHGLLKDEGLVVIKKRSNRFYT